MRPHIGALPPALLLLLAPSDLDQIQGPLMGNMGVLAVSLEILPRYSATSGTRKIWHTYHGCGLLS